MTSLQTSAKADTGQVSTHLADNTGTTNYDVALSERIGDYDIAFADIVIQNLAPVLN